MFSTSHLWHVTHQHSSMDGVRLPPTLDDGRDAVIGWIHYMGDVTHIN